MKQIQEKVVWVCLLVAFFASACDNSLANRDTGSSGGSGGGSSSSSTDDPIYDPVTHALVDNDFMKVGVTVPTGKSATMHQYGKSWDTACQIGFDDASTDILCVVEGLELQLYSMNGKPTLNYNFPRDMCKYVGMIPYFFYQKLAGYGPSAITMTVTDGVSVLNSTTDVTPGITAVLDANGELKCTANYEEPEIFVANCCVGDYTLTKTEDGTATTEAGNWGGAISNCLAGPAVTTQTKDSTGFPTGDLIDMVGIGLNRDYAIDPPLSLGYYTNLYIANYFDVTDSFPGSSADTFPAEGTFDWDTAPIAMEGAVRNANPWYEFDCLDDADDYIHRIRVMIRSWSTQEEYDLGVDGAYDSGVGGTEEAFFTQQFLLDRYGWFDSVFGDLMTEYPGDPL